METNKPFWMSADKTNINDLIKLMEDYTLDPIMLNYGKRNFFNI